MNWTVYHISAVKNKVVVHQVREVEGQYQIRELEQYNGVMYKNTGIEVVSEERGLDCLERAKILSTSFKI